MTLARRVAQGCVAAVLAMALLFGSVSVAGAWAGSENGSLSCGAVHDVNSNVRADGQHKHTIGHGTYTFANKGYVWTSTWYSSLSSASWTTSGGIGYYDFAASGGYCGS